MEAILKLIRLSKRFPLSTVSDLRNIIGKGPDIDYAITLGKNSLNDGFAAEFVWDAASLKEDDGDNVIKPGYISVQNTGRWIKVKRPYGDGGSSTVLPRTKKSTIIGDGVSFEFGITHNWNTRDLNVVISQDNSSTSSIPDTEIEAEILKFNNTVRVVFTIPPLADKKIKVLISEILI